MRKLKSFFNAKSLSLKDRLLSCLVIYNALREDRVYRNAFNHTEVIKIMKNEAEIGKIDKSIVEIFENIFE